MVIDIIGIWLLQVSVIMLPYFCLQFVVTEGMLKFTDQTCTFRNAVDFGKRPKPCPNAGLRSPLQPNLAIFHAPNKVPLPQRDGLFRLWIGELVDAALLKSDAV